jgi:hypothetical protein
VKGLLRQVRHDRRGAAAVLMVVVMVAVMGVAAVTIDVTRLMALRAAALRRRPRVPPGRSEPDLWLVRARCGGEP